MRPVAIHLGSFLLVLSLIWTGVAQAQVSGRAFEGFGGDNKEPIQINADRLVVKDEAGQLIYTGNVEIRQGTSLVITGELIVEYAKNGSGGQNDIERLYLSDGVVATSEENTASSDTAVYDVRTEDVTMEGNVVVSQGPNVAKGCRLDANLKTNVATIKSCGKTGGERVKSVFTPGSAD